MPRNRRQSTAGEERRGFKGKRKKSTAPRRHSSSKNPLEKTLSSPEPDSPSPSSPLISGSSSQLSSGSPKLSLSASRRRLSKSRGRRGSVKPRRKSTQPDSPSQSSPLISGSPSQISFFSPGVSSNPSRRLSSTPSRRLSNTPRRRTSLKPRRKSHTGDKILTKKKRRKSPQVSPLAFNSNVSHADLIEPPIEHLEGSDLDVSRRPWILQLPTKVRVVIWKLFNNSNLLILRKVCHRFKFDIDNFVGLHGIINQSHRSFGFFTRVGLQSVIITNLVERPYGKIQEMLVYPDLLLELSIQGSISDAYFAYLMENCRNLVHLEIEFSKRLLLRLPNFFPTADCENHLTQLMKLEITSETRFESELKCVLLNLDGLFTCNLRHSLSNFHIHLVHNVPSPSLRQCHQMVSNFVNANAQTLITLAVTIKEKRGDKSTRSVSDFDTMVNQFISHPPFIANSMMDLSNLLTTELKDEETDEPIDLEPLPPFNWISFRRLKEIHLSVNGINAEAWKDMPLEMRVLNAMYLDIVADDGGNWYMYRTTVHNCASTLRKVYLVDVTRAKSSYHVDHYDDEVNIDLGFFNVCRNLRLLTIKCQETGAGAVYRLRSVSEIPKTLTDVHFTWAILSPLQMIRLLVFYRHMHSFQVEYWSSSLSSFRRFLCLLKYVFKFGLTNTPLVTIVDHKLRFQSGIKNVKSIIKSLAPAAQYIDKEQTLLEIDTSILYKF